MPVQTSWDAFDRLFDEAFSRTNSKYRSGPFYPSTPDLLSPTQSPPYTLRSHTFAGATPYGAVYPRGIGGSYSDDSLGLTGIEDHYTQEDPEESIRSWNQNVQKTHKNTVVASRTVRPLVLPKSGLKLESESSGSKSAATSDSSHSPGFSASPTAPSPPPTSSSPPARDSSKSPTPPKLKKRKSKVNFQDSPDGKTVTATFDLQGVKKSDVHVSYQNDKVVISWESVTTEERTEGNRIIREHREKKYVRTLPLPESTKFEEVKASMDGRRLIVTYPKYRVRSTSPV